MDKNKYQKALDTIGARGVNDYGEETMKTVFAEEFFCLQELIDINKTFIYVMDEFKEIPQKIIEETLERFKVKMENSQNVEDTPLTLFDKTFYLYECPSCCEILKSIIQINSIPLSERVCPNCYANITNSKRVDL